MSIMEILTMVSDLVKVGINIMEVSMRATLREDFIMDMENITMLILAESMRANFLIIMHQERV